MPEASQEPFKSFANLLRQLAVDDCRYHPTKGQGSKKAIDPKLRKNKAHPPRWIVGACCFI